MDVHEPKQFLLYSKVQPVYSSFRIARNQAGHPVLDAVQPVYSCFRILLDVDDNESN
jgi:hypothetical protein